jgi:hypothetical protein
MRRDLAPGAIRTAGSTSSARSTASARPAASSISSDITSTVNVQTVWVSGITYKAVS